MLPDSKIHDKKFIVTIEMDLSYLEGEKLASKRMKAHAVIGMLFSYLEYRHDTKAKALERKWFRKCIADLLLRCPELSALEVGFIMHGFLNQSDSKVEKYVYRAKLNPVWKKHIGTVPIKITKGNLPKADD